MSLNNCLNDFVSLSCKAIMTTVMKKHHVLVFIFFHFAFPPKIEREK